MKNDAFLDDLARVAREQDPTADPRWDELAAGKLSPEQLRDLMQAQGTDAGPTAEAFRPLDDSVRARIADRLANIVENRKPEPSPANVISMPQRKRAAMVVGLVSTLAAAAGLLLFLSTRPRLDPVPGYSLMTVGGESSVRSEGPRGIPTLVPGSRLEVQLRPATRVTGPVVVRGALMRGDEVRLWTPPVQTDEAGAVRIAGTRETLFPGVPDGTWDVVLIVGRQGAMPSDEASFRRFRLALEPSDAPARATVFTVVLEPAR